MVFTRLAALVAERAVPIRPGDDLGVAKDFYVGTLGFTVQWEDTADGKNGIMALERGAIELTIESSSAASYAEAARAIRDHARRRRSRRLRKGAARS